MRAVWLAQTFCKSRTLLFDNLGQLNDVYLLMYIVVSVRDSVLTELSGSASIR